MLVISWSKTKENRDLHEYCFTRVVRIVPEHQLQFQNTKLTAEIENKKMPRPDYWQENTFCDPARIKPNLHYSV